MRLKKKICDKLEFFTSLNGNCIEVELFFISSMGHDVDGGDGDILFCRLSPACVLYYGFNIIRCMAYTLFRIELQEAALHRRW
jgi:hypothetical protein